MLDAWVRHYPPDVFPTIWSLMDTAAERGDILVIEEVVVELARKDDDVHKSVKGHETMVIPIDEDIQHYLTRIMLKYGRLVDTKKNRSGCDPWVIALAQARGLTVVTAEKAAKNLEKPKIPDVCKQLGVPCIEIIDFFRQQGWRS